MNAHKNNRDKALIFIKNNNCSACPNYFKYKFPVMAYFSAFIAVFFDLGSFFTGCFLYATEYFDIKEKAKNVNKKYVDKKTVS